MTKIVPASTTEYVRSKDGTYIAYNKLGTGTEFVILIEGALSYRAFSSMTKIKDFLAEHFAVIIYDRRGRGGSEDTLPFSLEREIEDIEALIDVSGGSAFLYGISSGACLALEASYALPNKIQKLAIYEPPYDNDSSTVTEWKTYFSSLTDLIKNNNRADAVRLFMKFVGMADELVAGIEQSPDWSKFVNIAPTLLYDAIAIGSNRSIPIQRFSQLSCNVLVMNGEKGLPFMLKTAKILSTIIPGASLITLKDQTHNVSPTVISPILLEFFG